MKRLFLASLVSATLIGCGGSDGGDKKPTAPENQAPSVEITDKAPIPYTKTKKILLDVSDPEGDDVEVFLIDQAEFITLLEEEGKYYLNVVPRGAEDIGIHKFRISASDGELGVSSDYAIKVIYPLIPLEPSKPVTPEDPTPEQPLIPLEPSTPVEPETPDEPLIPLEPSTPLPTGDCDENYPEEDCWDNGFTNPNEPEIIDTVAEFAEALHITESDVRILCDADWLYCSVSGVDGEPVINYGGMHYKPRTGDFDSTLYPYLDFHEDIYNENTEITYTYSGIHDANGTNYHLETPDATEYTVKEDIWGNKEVVIKQSYTMDYELLQTLIQHEYADTRIDIKIVYDNGFVQTEAVYDDAGFHVLAFFEPEAYAIFLDIANYWTTQHQ